jgi:hypothetical protein
MATLTKFPTSNAVASGMTGGWNQATAVYSDSDTGATSYAQANTNANSTQYGNFYSGFDFSSIPAGAVITSVTVYVSGGATASSINSSSGYSFHTDVWADHSAGSASTQIGSTNTRTNPDHIIGTETWTEHSFTVPATLSQLQASGFAVRIRWQRTTNASTFVGRCDYLKVTVVYETAQTVSVTGYNMPLSFGTAVLNRKVPVTSHSLPLSFGTAQANLQTTATSYNLPLSFGTPQVNLSVAVTGHNLPLTITAPTVVSGATTVVVAGYDLPLSFAAATVVPGTATVAVTSHSLPLSFPASTVQQHPRILATSLELPLSITTPTVAPTVTIPVTNYSLPMVVTTPTTRNYFSIAPTALELPLSFPAVTVRPSVTVPVTGYSMAMVFSEVQASRYLTGEVDLTSAVSIAAIERQITPAMAARKPVKITIRWTN